MLRLKILRRSERERTYWAHGFFEEHNELFFERSPRLFEPIYDFYTTGELHIPQEVCSLRFARI